MWVFMGRSSVCESDQKGIVEAEVRAADGELDGGKMNHQTDTNVTCMGKSWAKGHLARIGDSESGSNTPKLCDLE